ncbi:Protein DETOXIFICATION 44, chloroplastic [Porphyridium purpureum]|uniref:Protein DETOXIFICATION 44, chloroplastic n=1 Tax=Porphyridium purpureum TaxID=35688 RepID=A0A5J4YXH2_PORPP|nr:Protein DETOXIFICATION 44, chloroplastic [Porphyridium purpureum]|eukprot:POR9205..scf209_3
MENVSAFLCARPSSRGAFASGRSAWPPCRCDQRTRTQTTAEWVARKRARVEWNVLAPCGRLRVLRRAALPGDDSEKVPESSEEGAPKDAPGAKKALNQEQIQAAIDTLIQSLQRPSRRTAGAEAGDGEVAIPSPQVRVANVVSKAGVEPLSSQRWWSSPKAAKRRFATFLAYGSEYDAEIWSLALPSYGTMILDPLATLIDTSMVGMLGAMQLGGVGAANPMCSYVSWIFFFLSVTTTSGVARCVAREDRVGASRTIALNLWVALILGCLSFLIMFSVAPALMTLIGCNPEVLSHAVDYLRTRAFGAPATLTFFVASGALRGFQDLRMGFYASMLANAINLLLDYVLMFPFGLGTWGAGFATSFSQYASSMVLLASLFRSKRLSWDDMKRVPSFSQVMDVLKPGGTLMTRKALENISFALSISYLASLGVSYLAAQEITRTTWIVCGTAYWPLGATTQVLCSKLLAQERFSAVHRVTQRLLRLALLISASVSICVLLGSNQIPSLFGASETLRPVASQALKCAACVFPIAAMLEIFENVVLSRRLYKFATLAMAASFTVMSIGITMVRRLHLGLRSVWLVTGLFFVTRLLFSAWRIELGDRLDTAEVQIKNKRILHWHFVLNTSAGVTACSIGPSTGTNETGWESAIPSGLVHQASQCSRCRRSHAEMADLGPYDLGTVHADDQTLCACTSQSSPHACRIHAAGATRFRH